MTSLEDQIRAVNFTGLSASVAQSPHDWNAVETLRRQAYEQRVGEAMSGGSWISNLDTSTNCEVILCKIDRETPVGTIRVEYEHDGKVELDQYISYRRYLKPNQIPVAQVGRLAVLNFKRHRDVANALLKAAWLRLVKKNIPIAVIAAPEWMLPMYAGIMRCVPLGPDTTFVSRFGNPAVHHGMWIPSEIREHWTAADGTKSPLYRLWLEEQNPELEI